MPKVLTLCLVHNDTHVLLGMKKRGFGEGKWNGFGGKAQKGESIETAAVRELWEESGLLARKLDKRGVLLFHIEGEPEHHEVHIFSVPDVVGEVKESEEMESKWFTHAEIPFEHMWPDDQYWLPLLLAGKRFRGAFLFRDNETLLRHSLSEAEKRDFADDIARRV